MKDAEVSVNRCFKSRLFVMVFEDKKELLGGCSGARHYRMHPGRDTGRFSKEKQGGGEEREYL